MKNSTLLISIFIVIVFVAVALYFYSASLREQIHPVSVTVSMQTGPGPTQTGPRGILPAGGPPTWIMVNVNASSADAPVIQLSTTILDYDSRPLVCNFSINKNNPLMPGQNISTTCGYHSLGAPVVTFITNGNATVRIATVLVEGTLQNGQTFRYLTNETVS